MSEQRVASRKLFDVWNNAVGLINQMNGDVRPQYGDQIFSPTGASPGSYDFEIRPVTFYVTERASSTTGWLYIVLSGRISVAKQDVRTRLRTTNFSTEVAYFRERLPRMEHVYGAHYDYAPAHRGHPLFHAQMRGYRDRAQHAARHFQLEYDPAASEADPMDHVLRTARLPCAQLDAFSMILQIAADHLIDDNSSDEQLKLLGDLASEVRKIQGIGDILSTVHEAQCMRGVHWYPASAA